jgi:hypothetical protein
MGYDLPTLQRHGDMWVHHLPERRQASIRCPHGITHNEILYDAGIIHGAAACFIATSKVRTLPEMHGSVGVHFGAPDVSVPVLPPLLAAHGLSHIEDNWSIRSDDIDSINRQLAASQRHLDVDTVLHVRRETLDEETRAYPDWVIPLSTLACVLAMLLGFACRARVYRFIRCHEVPQGPVSNPGTQDPSSRAASPCSPDESTVGGIHQSQVAFTIYGLHCSA